MVRLILEFGCEGFPKGFPILAADMGSFATRKEALEAAGKIQALAQADAKVAEDYIGYRLEEAAVGSC